MASRVVRCPRCHTRLCDRLPDGRASGHFRCHRCKLELIIELTGFSEALYVLVTSTAGDTRRRIPDGRVLVTWAEFAT